MRPQETVQEPTVEVVESVAKKDEVLRDKLTKDLGSATTQLANVQAQLEQLQKNQQLLLQQKIALDALSNYLKSALG